MTPAICLIIVLTVIGYHIIKRRWFAARWIIFINLVAAFSCYYQFAKGEWMTLFIILGTANVLTALIVFLKRDWWNRDVVKKGRLV